MMENKIQINIPQDKREEALLFALWVLYQLRTNQGKKRILSIYEKQADRLLNDIGLNTEQ